MEAVRLTSLEKKVLHGVCQYPALTDTELAARLEVKRSSLTAARNRLMRQGILRNFYLPDFERLGITLIGMGFGSFKPGVKFAERRKTSTFADIAKSPHLVFAKTTDSDYTGFFLAKDYAEIKQLLQETWFGKYGSKGFLAEANAVVSPLKLSRTEHFFDFTEKLKELFSFSARGSP